MALHAESSEPLYLQLRTTLLSWIKEGKVRPHDKIPSERELCERFGVSRMTVRQALSKLKEDGLIYTRHGKGMFVAEPHSELEVTFVLSGYSEETALVRDTLRSSIINARLVQATAELADAMGLSGIEELVRIEQLRLLNETPIGFQTIHIPHRLCPGYLNQRLNAKASLEIIQDEYHLHPVKIAQVIRAGLCSQKELEYLKLAHPAPVLILERKTFLDTGAIVELSRSAYLADCSRLLLSLDLSRWGFRVARNDGYPS